MGNSVLRIFLAAWSVLVPDAPAFLSGRRMGVDLSILAYKALSNVDTCAALYAGDQRFFVSQIKKWVTRVLLWGVSPVIVFDSDRDPVFAPKLPEQQRRRAEVAAASAALAAGGHAHPFPKLGGVRRVLLHELLAPLRPHAHTF